MNPPEHDADTSGEGGKTEEMPDEVARNIRWLEEYARKNAVRYRKDSSPQMPETVQALIQSGDPRVITFLLEFMTAHVEIPGVIEQLAAFGEPAVLQALEAFHMDHAQIRKFAVDLLGWLGDDRGFSLIVQALKDDYPGVRISALWAVVHFKHPSVLSLVIEALQDNDRRVRREAISVLSFSSFWGEEQAITALMDLRKDPDGEVRADVIQSLGRHREMRAIPYFLEAIQDGHESVRCGAARALAEMRETQAIPLLISMLADSTTRQVAGRALVKFGDKDAVAAALLTDEVLSVATKLDTLEVFIKIDLSLAGSDVNLNYRSPSVTHYCQELLQKEIPLSAKEAIQEVLGEIRTRRDRPILLRASASDSKAQELLRSAVERSDLSPPEVLMRASEKTEETPTPHPSWLERLFRRRR